MLSPSRKKWVNVQAMGLSPRTATKHIQEVVNRGKRRETIGCCVSLATDQ